MRLATQPSGILLVFSILVALAAPAGIRLNAQAQDGPGTTSPTVTSPQSMTGSSQFRSGSKVNIANHQETGKLSYAGTEAGTSIPQPTPLSSGVSPDEAARSFLSVYGSSFGIDNSQGGLILMKEESAPDGRTFVRYQQVFQGIPVLGAELIVQMDGKMDVLSINGEALPDMDLSTTAAISPEEARLSAEGIIAREHNLPLEDLESSHVELWIYNPILLGGPGLPLSRLAWRVDVRALGWQPVRELVLVDAVQGQILLHFNQEDAALSRAVYDNNNNSTAGLPGIGPVRSEGGLPTGVKDADLAYEYSGNAYNFYHDIHGRDSLDGMGMPVVSTVRYCSPAFACPYENAYWNGSEAVFGQGYAFADDVVGHELTHGVTEFTSGLFYYMQSGAINESLADIWGELIDLSYNGPLDNDDPSVRWLLGEDLPMGAIRSLSNPAAYADPDKMSSDQYDCRTSDNGGVHSNSGVGNKAAYLMVDGGSFNGYSVSGLGIHKAARIFYEAQTHLLTSAADYADLAVALSQACTDLLGTSGITSGDCTEVRKAIAAVEMTKQPAMCAVPEAPVCDAFGSDSQFDGSLNGWTPASGTWGVDADYVFTHGEVNRFVTLASPESPDDFELTVRMKRSGCAACQNGLILRGGPESRGSDGLWNSGYAFLYTRSGLASVWRLDGASQTLLMGWASTGAVNTGDSWNTLHLTVRGSSFFFYINDNLVWSGSDAHYQRGNAGILMFKNSSSSGDLLQVDWAKLVGGTPVDLFFDDLEKGSGNWTHMVPFGSDQWRVTQGYARSGLSMLNSPTQGSITDTAVQMSMPVSLPSSQTAYLRFDHAYEFEDAGLPTTHYDGGVLEYSVIGGILWPDAGVLPMDNGYTGEIASGFSNPLATRRGFIGKSHGYVSTRLNLDPVRGRPITFRFRLGTDSVGSSTNGWFIDNVRIYTCVAQVNQVLLPVVVNP